MRMIRSGDDHLLLLEAFLQLWMFFQPIFLRLVASELRWDNKHFYIENLRKTSSAHDRKKEKTNVVFKRLDELCRPPPRLGQPPTRSLIQPHQPLPGAGSVGGAGKVPGPFLSGSSLQQSLPSTQKAAESSSSSSKDALAMVLECLRGQGSQPAGQ